VHIHIMSKTSDPVIAEVLKLYDMIDEHKIPHKLQPTNVFESDIANMGNSNVIPYKHYVKHNEASVVPNSASSVLNDGYVMHENTAVIPDESLTTKHNIYNDQVAIHEQHAELELTEREQKMDNQMCTPLYSSSQERELHQLQQMQ
jgi:hypothetical protein